MRKTAIFIPPHPARLLVLAHGYPWPDGSKTDDELVSYARAAVGRWRAFAERNRAILVAPAFGGREFSGYRELGGRETGADEFVNSLADEIGQAYLPDFHGIFSLHGHSAGAQFAARYLVAHPARLDHVILSAPSVYPLPGLRPGLRPGPRPEDWLAAATTVNVTVLVGTRDTEPRPDSPGHPGSTRIERADFWVQSMRRLSQAAGAESRVRLVKADGYDHDEAALAVPAQEALARSWAAG